MLKFTDSPTPPAAEDDYAITLVIEGPRGRREYPTTVGAAWAMAYDAYDHANSSCETTEDADFCCYLKEAS